GRRIGRHLWTILNGLRVDICRTQLCDCRLRTHCRQYRVKRIAPGCEIEMLRVVVIADVKIKHAVKGGDHPASTPNTRQKVLQRQTLILHRGKTGMGRVRIALSRTHSWLHELMVQEESPIARVPWLQFKLSCPPRGAVIVIGQRFTKPGDINMRFTTDQM